ncbi:MAG: hypothetical protein HYS21_04100 [Deltaproteobacteria bacterium]|nr:hypothetical protein [Deltaproteobacteria bacterium]
MDNAIGRKNMAFGFFYLLVTTVTGLYLADSLVDGITGLSLTGAQRAALASALLQANIDSILNVVAGYFLCRLPFVDWFSKTVSLLMIAGALLHSGVMYMTGFGLNNFVLHLAPVGAFLIISVMLLMGVGVISIRAVK